MADPYEKFETHTLMNGVSVHAAHLPERPVQVIRFIISAGHYHGQRGLAHFTEHLIAHSQGSGDSYQLRQEFEEAGGAWRGGTTDSHQTYYGFQLPPDYSFPATCARMFRYMFQPTWQVNLAHENSIFLSERDDTYANVPFIDKTRLARWLNTARGHFYNAYSGADAAFGSVEDIQNRRLEDVIAFHRQHYHAANLTIITAGPLPVSDVLSSLGAAGFGGLSATHPRTPAVPAFDAPATRFSSAAFANPNASLANFSADLLLNAPFPEVYLAKTIMAETLYEQMRQAHGFMYKVTANCPDIGGCYSVRLKVPSISPGNIAAAHQTYLQVVDSLTDGSPALSQRLTREQTKISNYYRSLEQATSDVVSTADSRLGNFGFLPSSAQVIDLYRRVTAERLRAHLGRFHPQHPHAYCLWKLPAHVSPPAGVPLLNLDDTLAQLQSSGPELH